MLLADETLTTSTTGLSLLAFPNDQVKPGMGRMAELWFDLRSAIVEASMLKRIFWLSWQVTMTHI